MFRFDMKYLATTKADNEDSCTIVAFNILFYPGSLHTPKSKLFACVNEMIKKLLFFKCRNHEENENNLYRNR